MKKSNALVPAPSGTNIARPPDDNSDEALIAAFVRLKRSPNTRRAYQDDIKLFRAAVPTPLARVTLKQLQDYVDTLRGKDATRARRIATVKSLFKFGTRTGYLRYDPAAVILSPRIKDQLAERILSREDVSRLLGVDDPGTHLIRFLYATGARVAELCSLTWRDCVARDDSGQVTLLGKGDKTRVVFLSPKTWTALNALRLSSDRPDNKVFEMKPHRARRAVRRCARKAGLAQKVSPHWLRHAHASHAIEAGAPLSLVQATLGHASLATTGKYLHARPKDSSARYLGI